MRSLVVLLLAARLLLSCSLPAAAQTTKLRIATCARTITAGLGAPFAVATKMGWFKQEGIEVEIVPLPGSTDCVKTIATKEVPVALPSVEPLAILRPQGVRAKFFYTAYQTNTYGIAVPADSPIQKHADLKGKTIGVTNMSSAGVIIARAQAAAAGLNPDTDITIVVAGEGAQPAVMLKNKQVDALSQFDTQYALTEIAGVKLRLLDTSAIARHPANGFIALEETIKNQRKDLIGARPRLRQGRGVRHRQPRGGRAHGVRGVPADEADRQGRGHRHPRRRQGAVGPHGALEAGAGRRQAVGRELGGQLPRLRRLHAEVEDHQAEGRHPTSSSPTS